MDYSINNNKIVIASANDKETIQYVYDIIYTYNGIVEHEKWISKRNDCVIFNYEPSWADMFKLVITLESGLVHNNFILFHLSQRLKNVEHLEKCLTI